MYMSIYCACINVYEVHKYFNHFSFFTFIFNLCRLAARVCALLKAVFTPDLTKREKGTAYLGGAFRNMMDPGWFPFGKIYAQDMLLVVICATYACISPLILISGICYFAIAAYLYTYQMLYVYEPMSETGGKWWPRVARIYILALIFAQSTMAGMMMLKQAWAEMYILFGLLVVTSIYLLRVEKTFLPVANQLPFDMATSLDLENDKSRCVTSNYVILRSREFVEVVTSVTSSFTLTACV